MADVAEPIPPLSHLGLARLRAAIINFQLIDEGRAAAALNPMPTAILQLSVREIVRSDATKVVA
jgi:hypothetical protein